MDETPKKEKLSEDKKKADTKIKSGDKNIIVTKYLEFKSEFTKIIWPNKNMLLKQTVTVIFTSLLVGALIAVMDSVFAVLFREFARLVG